jgi:hypothetical protein
MLDHTNKFRIFQQYRYSVYYKYSTSEIIKYIIHIILWYAGPGQINPKTVQLVFAASPLSTQHLGVRSVYWLAQNQDNVSEWSNISSRRLLFQ